MSRDTSDQFSKTEMVISERYGEILTLEEVREVLRYPSIHAVKKAYYRGTLPVKLVRFVGRQGLFSTAREIARCIDGLHAQCNHDESDPTKY